MAKGLRPEPNNSEDRLSAVLRDLDTKPTSDVKQTGLRIVLIDKLIPDPRNERRTYSDESIQEMAESIRLYGIDQPITATPVDGGNFLILAGHRRYYGAKKVGLDKVEIVLREPKNEGERRLISVITNIQREEVRPVELATGLRYILDNDPEIDSQDKLAERLGKRKQWVSDMLAILALPEEQQEAVRSTVLNADALSRVARVRDAELQKELVADLQAGASTREIKDRISQGKGRAPDANGETGGGTKPKNKIGLAKEHEADVIIQSRTTARLTWDRQVRALQAALKIAKQRQQEQS